MSKKFTVFSVHEKPVNVQAQLEGGAAVTATVNSLEVQLVPENENNSTVKLSFTDPAEIAEAQSLFIVGQFLTMNFSGGA